MILTSLLKEQFSPAVILELYRWRWRIELALKPAAAGHVPKSNHATTVPGCRPKSSLPF
ncbi:MAG: hypothetical protein JWM59_823 [Verrucomicrobiales bacterium]|nr:hypothetical protein [Verrucomicrobiales bacterium]